jgi:hypothetical protein
MNARPSMPATTLDSKPPLNVVDLRKFSAALRDRRDNRDFDLLGERT